MKEMVREDGVIALVIGDVAKSNINVVSLARELMRRLMRKETFAYVGCLSDHLRADVKTTRIWKETKGKATEVDRIVVLSDSAPSFNHERLEEDLHGVGSSESSYSRFDSDQLQTHAKDFAA